MARAKGNAGNVAGAGPGNRPSPLGRGRDGWIALAVLGFLLLVFFNPVFLAGKSFQPPDQLASVAHRPYIQEALHGSGDWFDRYPLWTPYIFSGMPSLGSMIAAPYTNPLSWATFFLGGPFKIIAYYLLLAFFSWLFLRRLGLGLLPALLGAAAFLFCPHVITLIMFGHNSKVCTLVLLPAVLLLTHYVWVRPGLRSTALLALAVGVLFLTHHLQIAYYTMLAAGLYLLVALVLDRPPRLAPRRLLARLGLWLAGVLIGVAASSILFLPVRDYAAHSIRGGTDGGLSYEYATNWSFHPLEMTTFFVPSFAGFGEPTYWGFMPFTDFPHYMGILVLLLAVTAVVLWPRERMHVFLVVLAVFSLLLSFGKHLPLVYDPMFKFFPYFNKFRVPSMILVLFQFSVAMLAALAVARLFGPLNEGERARARRLVLRLGAAFAVIVVLLSGLVLSGTLNGTIRGRLAARYASSVRDPDTLRRAVEQNAHRITGLVTVDAVVGLLLLALGVVLLLAVLRRRLPAGVAVTGLLVLTLVDLWRVDAKPAHYESRRAEAQAFAPTATVRFLQADQSLYRVLPLTGQGLQNNWFAYFKIPSIMGYHPAKLRIYQDLLDEKGPVGISKTLNQRNFNVVNMLNMKYLIASREIPLPQLVPVLQGEEVVMENTAVLPRMWFVDGAKVITDEKRHLEAVADPQWDPAREALMFKDVGPLDPGTGGTAEMTRYEPRLLEAKVQSPGNCLLVLSEVYYDAGWRAWIDDAPVPIYRANYVLRAVRVPPGSHILRLRFDSPAFRRGSRVTLASFGVIFLGIAASFIPRRRGAGAGLPAP